MVALLSKVKSASNIEDRLICRQDEQHEAVAHFIQNKHWLLIIIFHKQAEIVKLIIKRLIYYMQILK